MLINNIINCKAQRCFRQAAESGNAGESWFTRAIPVLADATTLEHGLRPFFLDVPAARTRDKKAFEIFFCRAGWELLALPL